MKRCIFFVILIISSTLLGQSINRSDRLRPQWLTKQLPSSKSGNYIFVKAEGSGSSLESARQACAVDLANHLERERGFEINSVLKQQMQITTTQTYNERRGDDAKISYKSTHTDDFKMEVVENGRKINMLCRTIDEYWVQKKGVYFVSILYTVADQNIYGGSYYDDISTTTRYMAAGFASIIPGAGQFIKGDIAKGVSFLVTDIIGVTGIIVCESTRAAYAAKVKQQPQYAQQYSTRANNWATGRNICLGVTAGIWVWNIIDAFAAKGARRVVVKKNNNLVQIQPIPLFNPISNTYDFGVGFSYQF